MSLLSLREKIEVRVKGMNAYSSKPPLPPREKGLRKHPLVRETMTAA